MEDVITTLEPHLSEEVGAGRAGEVHSRGLGILMLPGTHSDI